MTIKLDPKDLAPAYWGHKPPDELSRRRGVGSPVQFLPSVLPAFGNKDFVELAFLPRPASRVCFCEASFLQLHDVSWQGRHRASSPQGGGGAS